MKWKGRKRQENELKAAGWLSAPDLDPRFKAEDLAQLVRDIRGTVIAPTDRDYHRCRQLSNFAFQEFPLLIIYCEAFYDVRRCLKFAQDFKLPVVVRSGGHSTAGFSVNSGMVIDLSRLSYVVVDAVAKRAVVGAGTNFAHLNAALDFYKLHVPGGVCQDVCVAGFMQGGGYGLTSRQFGMNCDNVVEALVMLADGRVVVASATRNADLYWALRGGTGGNFGVLLQVTYQLHEIGSVWGVGVQWPLSDDLDRDRAGEVLAKMQTDYMRRGNVHERLGYQAFIGWQGEEPYLMMRAVFNGTRKGGKQAIAPLLSAAPHKITFDLVDSYYQIDRVLYDTPAVPQVPDLAREDKQSGYIDRQLSAGDWRAIIDEFLRTPNRWSLFATEPYGGRIEQITVGENAFVHRAVNMDVYVDVFWMTEEERVEAVSFLDRFMLFMNPYFNGQAYQNYPRSSQTDYRRLYWGEWFNPLLAVKQKYDPQNFFLYPQGISGALDFARAIQMLPSLAEPIVYEPYPE